MTALIFKSYTVALTPVNVRNSFRKTSIWPFNSDALHGSNFKPTDATVNKHEDSPPVDVTEFLNVKLVTRPHQSRHTSKRKQIGGMVISEGEGKYRSHNFYVQCIYSINDTKMSDKGLNGELEKQCV